MFVFGFCLFYVLLFFLIFYTYGNLFQQHFDNKNQRLVFVFFLFIQFCCCFYFQLLAIDDDSACFFVGGNRISQSELKYSLLASFI